MYPVLLHVGPYTIYTYGVFVMLGVGVLIATTYLLAREAGWNWGRFLPVMAGVLVGGVFGGRLSQLLVEPQRSAELLDFYTLFQTFTPGNIVGIIVGGYLLGTLVRLPLELPTLANQFAIGLAGASLCWRCGCTCAGCCYGTPTTSPLSIYLAGAYRHPTMVYEGLFNLVMLVLLLRLRRHPRAGKHLLMLYVGCYSCFRFWLEYIRVYPKVLWGLTGIQLICALLLLGLSVSWLWARRSSGAPLVVP